MAGNVIFRGPISRQAETITKPVTGALLPGSIVEETATALVALATVVNKRPLILANNEYAGQDIVTAFVNGATGQAYEPIPQDVYQCRMAAGTYTFAQPLTVGAGGRLTATVAGNPIVAWFADTPGARAVDALCDVKWANSTVAA